MDKRSLLGALSVRTAYCSLLLLSGTAVADISFNGFATLTGGKVQSGDINLDGYDDKFNFEENSILGLQATGDMGDGLTAVAQIIAKGSNAWDAQVAWAYIGYQATDNLKFIFGRQRVPQYAYSDYLDVGYAYHWITPPEGVYSTPFDAVNGIGAVFNHTLGSVDSTMHAVFGRSKDDLDFGGVMRESDLSNFQSLSWALAYDWLSFRVGYTSSDIKLVIPDIEDGLVSAWQQVSPGLTAYTTAVSNAGSDIDIWREEDLTKLTNQLSVADDTSSGEFVAAGFTVDHDNLLITTEFTQVTLKGTPFAESQDAWFVSGGWRFNKVMPHITFGANDATASDYSVLSRLIDPDTDTYVQVLNQDGSVAIDSALLVGGTQAVFEASRIDSKYVILGLKWNFHDSAAFKAEIKETTNNLTNATDTLLRIAVTTVF